MRGTVEKVGQGLVKGLWGPWRNEDWGVQSGVWRGEQCEAAATPSSRRCELPREPSQVPEGAGPSAVVSGTLRSDEPGKLVVTVDYSSLWEAVGPWMDTGLPDPLGRLPHSPAQPLGLPFGVLRRKRRSPGSLPVCPWKLRPSTWGHLPSRATHTAPKRTEAAGPGPSIS